MSFTPTVTNPKMPQAVAQFDNFKEVKKRLIAKGVIFKTKSDTEVILESFKMWKEKCLELLEGMFVFVILG